MAQRIWESEFLTENRIRNKSSTLSIPEQGLAQCLPRDNHMSPILLLSKWDVY